MDNELRLELEGTIFRFVFSDKGYDDGGYFWTDARIYVENSYFNYNTREFPFLAFSEIQGIYKDLSDLLKGGITEKTNIEFIEPDLQILLVPKRGKFSDVSAEFSFFMALGSGYTDQRYTLPLYREDIEKLVDFLETKIADLS